MLPEGRALEFLLAAVIALVVVGPKDLPILMRKLGQFTAKMRAMAAEFRASFDEMARQSELDELRKEVEAMRRAQYTDAGLQSGSQVEQTFAEIQHDLHAVGQDLQPAPAYHPAPSEPAPAAETPPAAGAVPEPPADAKPRAAAAGASSRKTSSRPRPRKTPEPKA